MIGRRLARPLLALVLLAAVAIAALAAALRPPAPLRPPPPGGLLSDVTLVEPSASRRVHRSLRIDGERIGAIGRAELATGDPYAGAFVLPGLTDMHVHFPAFRLPGEVELTAFLLVAHGITTVRVAADGREGLSQRVRDAVRMGEIAGPRILSCGPFVDGDPPLWPNSRVVQDAEATRAVVTGLADAGVDCINSTRSSPAFLGVDGLGELRMGAPAELAIYREDPTRDLAALDTLLAVVRAGRVLPRELLERQLALYHEHFHGSVYRRVVTPLARVAAEVLLARLAGSTDAEPQ